MTIKELKELLSRFDDNVKVNFKLIPNDGTEEDGDDNDVDIDCVGEIYTGGLDNEEPFVEIGFKEEQYTVWVGGGEVNDHYLCKAEAEKLAQRYIDDDYDDVVVEKI